MKAATKARKAKGWTIFKTGAEATIHPARLGQIENGRAIPYPKELARLADALGWDGDPEALLEEVVPDGAA